MREASVLLLLLLASALSAGVDDDMVVMTQTGRVRGVRQRVGARRVDAWLGIPFAKPPLGELRFRKPEPIEPWFDVRDTQSLPASCYQEMDKNFPGFRGVDVWNPNTPLSEDCLYLNVWVPQPRPKQAAVLVWIYGGGFVGGTSTLELYDGGALAVEQNVIVASMQYRVGALGFLFLDHPEAPGNQGLVDQVLALEWIQNNIQYFGGDSARITLFGESAGAASVGLHLLSPLSRDLFQRAVLQSGAPNADWAVVPRNEAKRRSLELVTRFPLCPQGVSDAAELVRCLRNVSAEEIPQSEWVTDGFIQFPFVATVDGDFLTESPRLSLERGNFKKCPLIVGSNLNEATYFMLYSGELKFDSDNAFGRAMFGKLLRSYFTFYPHYPLLLNAFGHEAVLYRYTPWLNPHDGLANRDAINDALADFHFVCQVNLLAQAYARHGQPVYYYYLTYRSTQNPWPAWMGVMHADEISFVFGEPFYNKLNFTPDEFQLARRFMRYWANFAKTGDPNMNEAGISVSEWPKHTVEGKEYLTMHVNNSDIGHGPRADYCAFWTDYLPKLVASTAGMSDLERKWKLEFDEWTNRHMADWKTEFDRYLRTKKGADSLCSAGG